MNASHDRHQQKSISVNDTPPFRGHIPRSKTPIEGLKRENAHHVSHAFVKRCCTRPTTDAALFSLQRVFSARRRSHPTYRCRLQLAHKLPLRNSTLRPSPRLKRVHRGGMLRRLSPLGMWMEEVRTAMEVVASTRRGLLLLRTMLVLERRASGLPRG